MTKTVLVALVLLALMLMNAQAISPVRAQQFRYGGSLVMGQTGDPAHLNSAITAAGITHFTAGRLFNSLVQWTTDDKVVPDLADSWEISKDGLTYTFHLVKNATWHDGGPFTSADVKFSIEQVLYKYHPRGKTSFGAVDTVETPDAYTAIIRMKNPYPAFLSFLGNFYAPILPKHLYDGTDILNNPYNLKPVGTGPFKFMEWVKGDHITVVRNENYFKKGKPYLDKIVYKIIPDVTSRVAALERGEIDYLYWYGFPNNEYERLGKVSGIKTLAYSNLLWTIQRMDFNIRKGPLSDVRVRQAIDYALDKNEILQKAMYGIGKVATGSIPSAAKWAYNPNVPRYELNLTMANRLLDDAGYLKGSDGMRFKTSLTYDLALPEFSKTAEIVRLRLREVGIDVLLRPMDGAAYQQSVANWDYEITFQRGATGPDPLMGTAYHWSKNIQKVFMLNNGGYNNSRYDWLYEQAAKEIDPKTRAAYYFEAQDIIARDLPSIWLIEADYPVAFRGEFQGLPTGAYDYEPGDTIFWTKGSDLSPESIASLIKDSQKQLDGLKGQFYDVTTAQKQLEQAKQMLAAGDYMKASELARSSMKLAQPPYMLYGGIGAIVIVALAVLLYRRKKTVTKT